MKSGFLALLSAGLLGTLAFANPDPTETCAAGRGNASATSEQEEGLRWDMMTQVGIALKSPTGLNARYIHMTSQGADVLTYAAAIQTHWKFVAAE